jgi:hypothetical protein
MPRRKMPKFPELPSDEVKHGWRWRKDRPPGARRPPQQIEYAHKLTPLQLLDAHVAFTSVGRSPGPMRHLLICPRCGKRRAALYTRPGVQGIGCVGHDCLNLSYPTEGRLKHPACSLERIAELVARFKSAKTRRSRERWRSKALAAGEEYAKRGQARAQRREAILAAMETAANAYLDARASSVSTSARHAAGHPTSDPAASSAQ